jgi:cytochrome c oxidase subunit II
MKRRIHQFQLATLVLASAVTMAAAPADAPRHIPVVASKFQFEPNQITVKKGEAVAIILTTSDVTHGLKIPELGINEEAKKGGETEIDFKADKVGTFQGKCAHFCGKGHGSMTFTVNVVE